MKIKIVNVYSDRKIPNTKFSAGHGQCFLISSENYKVLFDVGTKGENLLYNMEILGITPNSIDLLVFSHGHYDHTGGLIEFLKHRKQPIKIIAHPDIFKDKRGIVKRRFFSRKYYIGIPKLSKTEKKKVIFQLTKKPYHITSWLATTGEISDRTEKDGTSKKLLHKEGKKYVKDPLLDDQSLILKTKNGLVVLCGCCHAGVVNTLNHVKNQYKDEEIHSLIGGTHMLRFSREELNKIADTLQNKYECPLLFLNHCSGIYTIDYLKEILDEDRVKTFPTGSKLSYEIKEEI